MAKPKLLGIAGAPGSGKDTVGDFLVEGHEFAHIKFAQPLRDVCSESFGIPPHYLEDPRFKDMSFNGEFKIDAEDFKRFTDTLGYKFTGSGEYASIEKAMVGKEIKTPRELLQFIGTDVVRDLIDPNFWTHLAELKIKSWFDRGESVVVTDVRFENEVSVIKSLGGKIVKLERDSELVDEHPAENQQLDYDYLICNNGSKEELSLEVESILEDNNER